MADSRNLVLTKSTAELYYIPARTCGPLGINDHGDPNVTSMLGDTPGSLGMNDHADPSLQSKFTLPVVCIGTMVRSAEGSPLTIGMVVDSVRGWVDKTEDEAAYQFFAAFFDHYLPKKFLHHYVYGKGEDLTLTQQEMIDCNPVISVDQSKDFNLLLEGLFRAQQSVSRAFEIRFLAAAMTNGTLGQFTVKMKGKLEYRSASDWSVSGTMSFYDEWDFDIKDFKTGGRTIQGELKTRFAHYTLPGVGFKISSEEVSFTQTSNDASITWVGGTPQSQLDRVGKADVAIKGME